MSVIGESADREAIALADFARRCQAYLDDGVGDGRHSDNAGSNAYELIEEAIEHIKPLALRPTPAGRAAIVEALEGARNELAALVFKPSEPDFTMAVPNEADRACVEAAYRILTRALSGEG